MMMMMSMESHLPGVIGGQVFLEGGGGGGGPGTFCAPLLNLHFSMQVYVFFQLSLLDEVVLVETTWRNSY